MSWKKFDGPVTGTKVDGDPSVPATKWYNHLWLLMFGWKKVAVLDLVQDSVPKAPLRLGYRNAWGQAQLDETPLGSYVNRVRIGREACTFFVLDGDGKEVALKVVAITTKDDPAYKNVPLV